MNTRIKLLSCLAIMGLLFGAWGLPTAAAASGTGKITCDGDGTLVFSGDFVDLSLATVAGAVVHTKPATGSFTFTGSGFVKHTSGDVVIRVGSGSAHAVNVKTVKLTLSGADAHLEATGAGRLAIRGVGACTTASGKTYTWKEYKDTTLDLAP
jgi:hypothetical protein